MKSKAAGSYHWDLERALSAVSVPLIAYPFMFGSDPMVDLALGVVLPLHCYLGVGCIIEDYLPKRRSGNVYKAAKVGLGLATVLTMYGCYQLNTTDVGITETMKRIWTGN